MDKIKEIFKDAGMAMNDQIGQSLSESIDTPGSVALGLTKEENAIFHVLGNRTLHNATMSDINEYIRLTRKTIDAFEKRIANKQ